MRTIKQYWVAAAILLLCGCEEALETSLVDKKVVLLAPANNLVTTNTEQTFYWETVNGATKYQLTVVTPNFASIAKLVADTLVTKNNFAMTLTPGVYQWRVRAVNNSTQSAYSDEWKFTIQ